MSKIYLPLSLISLAVLGACALSDPVTPAPAPVVVQPPAPVVTAPPPTVVVPPAASAPSTVVVPPTAGAPAMVVVPAPAPLRAGFGRIESITAVPPSAAAGGTAKPQRRLSIKMEDGTFQYVDTAAAGLSIGDRVELTSDGQLRR